MLDTYDMSVSQGATYSRAISYRDPAGHPIDLSGATAAMQVRPFAGDIATPLLSLTSASHGGITLTTPALAPMFVNIEFSITATVTAALTPGEYVYDIELNFGAEVVRLIGGAFSVFAEVTR